MDTWRSWELVLPDLGRRHDVLALTLPGHSGGPSLPAPASAAAMVDAVEGTMDDKLLAYPDAATRYGNELAQADWVLLDGIGHCPQLDVPLEAAQLILGFTAPE